MSRATANARKSWRGVVACVAALVLAGCGTTAVVIKPHITGTPSLSISVPLQSVACTGSGSCVAAGADGSHVAPSFVGEVRRANGLWTALRLPNTPVITISSAACWNNQCLVGGTQPSGDALWLVGPSTQSVSVSPTPHAGRGVSAVSCFAPSSCAMVDTTGITGGSRLSFTSNGGATWTTPLPMTWTVGQSVTALSCTDTLNCLVATTNPGRQALLEVTHDAGTTWTVRPVPTTWTTLTSLTCSHLQCVGLVSTTSGSLVVRTTTFARLWKSASLANQANALACTKLSRCVLVGQTAAKSPWLATLKGLRVSNIALRYVPSPLTDAACGVKICAAVGVSTVLSLHP
jgi:hypothetical protein